MPIVRTPLYSEKASGKFATQVFQAGKRRTISRRYVSPPDPATPAQLDHRAIIATLSTLWRALSPSLRDAWNAAAYDRPVRNRVGQLSRLSGFNLYARVNTIRRQLDTTPLDSPPTPTPAPFFTSCHWVWIETNEIRLSWTTSTPPTSAYFADIWVTQPLSPGRRPTIHWATHYYYQPANLLGVVVELPGSGRYGVFLRLIHTATSTIGPWTLLDVLAEL